MIAGIRSTWRGASINTRFRYRVLSPRYRSTIASSSPSHVEPPSRIKWSDEIPAYRIAFNTWSPSPSGVANATSYLALPKLIVRSGSAPSRTNRRRSSSDCTPIKSNSGSNRDVNILSFWYPLNERSLSRPLTNNTGNPRARAMRIRFGHSSTSTRMIARGLMYSKTRFITGGKSTGKYNTTSGAFNSRSAIAWAVDVVVVRANSTPGSRSRHSCISRSATNNSPTLTA